MANALVGRCAKAFAQGPKFYNTLGSEAVCSTAGLAILDIVL